MLAEKRVLVIDDSPFVYKAVKKALEPHGYQIIGHAENGQEGIELIAHLEPHVVTLDITMPILDGIETARILLKEMNTNTKIIMLSAMGDDVLIEQARGVGVEYFMPKPFKAQMLLNMVNDIFAKPCTIEI